MAVLTCNDIDLKLLCQLLAKYDLLVHLVDPGQPIPGSWFGEPEAGLVGNTLYVRPDTPVHSALHESCHYICMSADRRVTLDTNAGGGYDEENGVCYLSILLSDFIEGFGRERMFADMDEWGYTFRLGSSRAWFEQDAEDAIEWLSRFELINPEQKPSWRLRQ